MQSQNAIQEIISFDYLEGYYKEVLVQAIRNILSTDLADSVYAQILDGLPTTQSMHDSFVWMKTHPVSTLGHENICDGFIEKARSYRSRFQPSDLHFDKFLLDSFRNATAGSTEFYLRLIELIVIACHDIGAHLYELDEGAHKHSLHEEWLARESQVLVNGFHPNGHILPPGAFFHVQYRYPEQYPRGLADVAGYWVEAKIFGGVVVFDKGENEDECRSMWISGGHIDGPGTLYPPTSEQFEALVRFLLADGQEKPPHPLPIHGTSENRPRWDADEAFAKYHIFRNKYERKVNIESLGVKAASCHENTHDWPEIVDDYFLATQAQAEYQGLPVDKEGIKAARQRLKEVTPTSPCRSYHTSQKTDD